jgi:transposase
MNVENLDDLPLIGHQLVQSQLSGLLDNHFPDHGHWRGITGGQVAIGWLLYFLSEADHRLSHVEDWASLKLESLAAILGETQIRSADFNDDRLGRLLDRYSDDDAWASFEKDLGNQLLQVYQIYDTERAQVKPHVIRTDSFNAPQFREVTELFTYGYSKQRRSDRPFCKVMVSALDEISLPLAVEINKGGGPDSDHYMTNIKRVQSILPNGGNLYVGDSQLGTMSNRLAIHISGDYYLMPLGRKQCVLAELHGYLSQIDQPYDKLESLFTSAEQKRSPAYFKEICVELKIPNDGGLPEGSTEWTERRILVYSPDYAEGLIKSFNGRLDEAELSLQNMMIPKSGRKVPKTEADLHLRKDRIINQYGLEGCFEITCTEKREYIKVQKHKVREAETREIVTLHLDIKRDKMVIEKHKRQLGWQVYATNVPQSLIETSTLVTCYRDEYRIEHLFDTWINKSSSFLPLFLKKETRIKGLIRLLSVAIRYGVLIQHQVRASLSAKRETITGLYAGNKARATESPTTSMILRAFRGISIAWIEIEGNKFVQMSTLTAIQQKLLECLDATESYLRILNLLKSRSVLRET